jgi:protein-tyrosine phosphatase
MIDLHLHVLPAVDDGAAGGDESREMLSWWAGLGFTDLVTTPHLYDTLDERYWKSVERAFGEARLWAEEVGITLHQGFESMLTPRLAWQLEAGDPRTLGSSRAVLIELPFFQWPGFTESSLFDVQAAGYRPILAHPERYSAVQDDTDKALGLAERGVILQVTHGSLTGALGKRPKRVAERLLEEEIPVILASDAHSTGHRLRSIEDGLRRAEALVGEQRTRDMSLAFPRALLFDEPLPELSSRTPGPQAEATGGRLRRLFGVR